MLNAERYAIGLHWWWLLSARNCIDDFLNGLKADKNKERLLNGMNGIVFDACSKVGGSCIGCHGSPGQHKFRF